MSLQNKLSLIQHKDYEPIFTAKINTKIGEKILQKRPKTTNNLPLIAQKLKSSTTPRPFTSVINSSQIKSIDLKNSKHLSNQSFAVPLDQQSQASTNLSLLSITSNDEQELMPIKKTYGQFNYFSYFERYMNRKAKFKISTHLLPKVPENKLYLIEAPLYEMLDRDELNNLYYLFDVTEAVPFRLRSNSISKFGQQDQKQDELKGQLIKTKSLEDLENHQHAESEDNIIQNLSQRDKEEAEWKQRKADLLDKKSSLELDYVYARNIKCPKVYVLGSHNIKIKDSTLNRDQNKNKNDMQKQSYNHIGSKLSAYIKQNREKTLTESFAYVKRSQVAIKNHQILLSNSPNSLNTRGDKNGQTRASNHLKMSKMLDGRIRDDLKMNKGPIYFAQLTEENLQQFDEQKQLKLSNKYEFIFEWLEKMNVEECKPYFLANPFKLDQEAQTNIQVEAETSNQNEEFTYENETRRIKNELKDSMTSKYNVSTSDLVCPSIKRSRIVIDPFENPKHQRQERKFPKFFLKNSIGKDFRYETYEKHALAAKSDQTALEYLLKNQNFSKKQTDLVKLNSSILSSKNYDHMSCLNVRDNLKKQLVLNDFLLTRMQLDLFII